MKSLPQFGAVGREEALFAEMQSLKPQLAPESAVAPASDVVDPLWRRVLNDRFTILEPIGAGGMGKVYRAIQAPLDRVVALKVLNSQYANGLDPEFRRRFFLEASMTAKLRHPSTVTVIDYGETKDGIFFIAMEFLEGIPLSQVLKPGPLPWMRAINIAQQICRSLREAHRMGIIHRDLKPANVMLLAEEGEQDIIKVLDFGLVKSLERNPEDPAVTHAGVFVGSPLYMSPEQARHQTDTRSDIYSLGVLFYQMLVGRPPFVSKNAIELITKHHQDRVPPFRTLKEDIDVPPSLESLVMKCLEKDPAARFQSMDAVLQAMRAVAPRVTNGKSGVFEETPSPMPQAAAVAETGPGELGDKTLAIHISVVGPTPLAALANESRRGQKYSFLKPVVVILLIATSIAIATSVWWDRPVPPTAPATPSSVAKVVEPPAPPAVKIPAAPAEPPTAHFKILSEPVGAKVWIARRLMGTTPFDFTAPADTDGTATVELLFTLKGYHSMTVIAGGSGNVVLKQRLQPKTQPKPKDVIDARVKAVVSQPEGGTTLIQTPAETRAAVSPEDSAKPPVPTHESEPKIASNATSAPHLEVVPAASKPPRLLPRFVTDVQRVSASDPHLPESFTERHNRGSYDGRYRLCVGTDGRVKEVSILSSIPGADQAIIAQIKDTWVYRPQAVPFCTEHRFVFKID